MQSTSRKYCIKYVDEELYIHFDPVIDNYSVQNTLFGAYIFDETHGREFLKLMGENGKDFRLKLIDNRIAEQLSKHEN